MTRKRIAVFMASIDREYQQIFAMSMTDASKEFETDICIFNCQGFSDSNVTKNTQSEACIFDLPSPDQFDGFIVLPATMPGQTMLKRIRGILASVPEKPVVSIDVTTENGIGIMFDDTVSLEKLTRQMVEEQKLTKFACVTGPTSNPISQNRFHAVEKTLAEYGIHMDPEMIREGKWTREAGAEAARLILQHGRPEAIFCSNDYSAFGVMDTLRDAGLRVPEDIRVTGFDALSGARVAGLTTVNRPISEAARLAVQLLLDEVNGIKPDKSEYILPTEVVHGITGGEMPENDKREDLASSVKKQWNMQQFLTVFGTYSSLLAGVGDETEASELIADFGYKTGLHEMYICVDPGLVRMDILNKHNGTYPDEMLLLSGLRYGFKTETGLFNTEDLLPVLKQGERDPRCMIFCPLYSRDLFFGYAAIAYSTITSYGLYPSLMLVSGALTSLNLQMNLKKSAALVEHMALHDSMTGMLNRRGYEKYASELFRDAKENACCFALLSVDMDKMKYVNDRYGHQAGDEAICRLGRVLIKLEAKGYHCVHISGDEFLVYGLSQNAESAGGIITIVERELQHLNESDPWLCDISASMGIYAAVPSGIDMLDGFLTQADRNMYADKNRKKGRQ